MERGRGETRVAELEAILGETDPVMVRNAIVAMMLGIPSSRASGEEAKAIVAAYVGALADLPGWAVMEAAMRFARGQVAEANPAFAPSAAEVRIEAQRLMTPVRAEIIAINRILAGIVA